MYVERSGTVPQQDLSSVVLLLANGPSVDAGAELSMAVPQQDLTSVLSLANGPSEDAGAELSMEPNSVSCGA
jgi:hypothetical protein